MAVRTIVSKEKKLCQLFYENPFIFISATIAISLISLWTDLDITNSIWKIKLDKLCKFGVPVNVQTNAVYLCR